MRLAVENQDAFSLDNLAVSEVKLSSYIGEVDQHSPSHEDVVTLVKHVRAVAEPLLHNHFGDGIIDDCFKIYEKLIVEPMSKEKMVLTNFTISLIRS
ncbi:hypothetical protein MLD38_028643 [Melastoma candidum]|uniref:Uncharacterized protein n=1 Tax=Melastoma candidum TaxID=119954 RepID=A0ACB9N2F8_9MYRT|nr:hypothetical protein MLD38_028643 [Melastoma candidum]